MFDSYLTGFLYMTAAGPSEDEPDDGGWDEGGWDDNGWDEDK